MLKKANFNPKNPQTNPIKKKLPKLKKIKNCLKTKLKNLKYRTMSKTKKLKNQ